ncbi:MAG: cupredoxin family copper-binding protein [Coriobacteriia bacterium]|nr:cupredoxin family copper-binding protein [Coriobacteriia bacterium]
MKRLTTLGTLALAALVLVVVSGCASSTPATTPATTPPPATSGSSSSGAPATSSAAVTIANFAFSPSNVTVAVGGTVTWTNNDSVPHTVTGADFDSGPLSPGKTFSHTFPKAGSFDYKCTIHPSMAPGKVTVQ